MLTNKGGHGVLIRFAALRACQFFTDALDGLLRDTLIAQSRHERGTVLGHAAAGFHGFTLGQPLVVLHV